MNRLLNGMALDDAAIELLRMLEPADGYWLAYSGGKDSTVILDLMRRSGCRFEAHYSYVPIDPPELRAFVREQEGVIRDMPKRALVTVAREYGCMPLRNRRWCCAVLKEGGGAGRHVVTGVRRAESVRRSARKQVEQCTRGGGRRFVNPIIDWSDADVWTYIRERGLPYCRLYEEGWKRLGCVLCPMTRDVERQMNRWPQIARVWHRMAEVVFEIHQVKGDYGFPDAETLWHWWLDRDAPRWVNEPGLFDDAVGVYL